MKGDGRQKRNRFIFFYFFGNRSWRALESRSTSAACGLMGVTMLTAGVGWGGWEEMGVWITRGWWEIEDVMETWLVGVRVGIDRVAPYIQYNTLQCDVQSVLCNITLHMTLQYHLVLLRCIIVMADSGYDPTARDHLGVPTTYTYTALHWQTQFDTFSIADLLINAVVSMLKENQGLNINHLETRYTWESM